MSFKSNNIITKEYDLLMYFSANNGIVLSREKILDYICLQFINNTVIEMSLLTSSIN